MRKKKYGEPTSALLAFLDDHIDITEHKSSDTKTTQKKNDQVLITLDMIQSLMKEKSDDDDDAVVDATTDVLSSLFNKSLEDTINKFTEPKCSALLSSTSQYPKEVGIKTEGTTAECCSNIIISDVVSLNTKEKINVSEDSTEINTLKRKLDDSDSVRSEIPNYKILKTDIPGPSKPQHDIPVFFKEIGEYVTARFSPKKQMELRLKVLSLVTEAELELLHGDDE